MRVSKLAGMFLALATAAAFAVPAAAQQGQGAGDQQQSPRAGEQQQNPRAGEQQNPGIGEQQQSPRAGQQQQNPRAGEQQQAHGETGKQLSISGEVIAHKQIDIQGTSLKHQIVRVKTDDNDRVTVDLGPHDRINKKVQNGDKIQVSGHWGRVQDQVVLFASEVDMGGQKTMVQRQRRGKVEGEVMAVHRVGLKDSDTKHRLAIIRTDRGKLAVDLGDEAKFKGKISEGDQVTVRGSLVKIQDRPVLMASSIDNQGNTITIER